MSFINKKIILFLFISFFTTIPAKSEDLENILENLQKTYKNTKTIQAVFKQETILNSINQKQLAEGKVYIKKPGLMRWEYELPEKQLIITDNKYIFIYIPEDKQVIKEKMNNMFASSVPAVFLSGDGDLKKKFDITFDKEPYINNMNIHKLILTPKLPQPTLAKLLLYVDKKDFQIKKSSIYDIYNNITSIRFSNIVVNKKISSDIFDFIIPEGVEVISPPRFQ